MAKKILLIVSSFLLLLIAFGVGAGLVTYSWWNKNLQPVDPNNNAQVRFEVKPNSTATGVAAELRAKSLIRSERAFTIYLRLNQLAGKLKPGIYNLSTTTSLPAIVSAITKGPSDLKVTFPEGWRKEQVAARLESQFNQAGLSFSGIKFLGLAKDFEGQLFPDTYQFAMGATEADVFNAMTTTFVKKSQIDLNKTFTIDTNIGPVSYTGKELVILASLVEREGKTDSDRPVIAGILYNRLAAGWSLDIDATVQYGRDNLSCASRPLTCDYWQPITDTKLNSSYNTYLNPGLPPGPIASPGLASLKAAVSSTTSKYMFYLHETNGTPHYAQTLQEHTRNVDTYLKI